MYLRVEAAAAFGIFCVTILVNILTMITHRWLSVTWMYPLSPRFGTSEMRLGLKSVTRISCQLSCVEANSDLEDLRELNDNWESITVLSNGVLAMVIVATLLKFVCLWLSGLRMTGAKKTRVHEVAIGSISVALVWIATAVYIGTAPTFNVKTDGFFLTTSSDVTAITQIGGITQRPGSTPWVLLAFSLVDCVALYLMWRPTRYIVHTDFCDDRGDDLLAYDSGVIRAAGILVAQSGLRGSSIPEGEAVGNRPKILNAPYSKPGEDVFNGYDGEYEDYYWDDGDLYWEGDIEEGKGQLHNSDLPGQVPEEQKKEVNVAEDNIPDPDKNNENQLLPISEQEVAEDGASKTETLAADQSQAVAEGGSVSSPAVSRSQSPEKSVPQSPQQSGGNNPAWGDAANAFINSPMPARIVPSDYDGDLEDTNKAGEGGEGAPQGESDNLYQNVRSNFREKAALRFDPFPEERMNHAKTAMTNSAPHGRTNTQSGVSREREGEARPKS